MEGTEFMGAPLIATLILIVFGMVVGAFIPLKVLIRSKLHFTIMPNDKLTMERDSDALSKLLPKHNRDEIIGFCNILRRLGLTLHIK